MRICPFALILFCVPWLSGCNAPEGASPEPETDSSPKTAEVAVDPPTRESPPKTSEAAVDPPTAGKAPRRPVVQTDPHNPVVVRTEKLGNLRERDLAMMQMRRARVLEVLTEAAATASKGPPDLARYIRGRLEAGVGETTEESVAEGWLLARSAEEFGMTISDYSVNSFLRDFTENRLAAKQWSTILKKHGMSERQFFDALREELLAMRFRQTFQYGQSVLATPPAQRWGYFTRLKRQATIEVAAIPVGKYLAEVPDPQEAALRKFFEDHRYNFARRDSPVPGFREPRKVNVEYLAANLQQFAAAAVTEQEIKRHYEKNREKYERLEKAIEDKTPAEDSPLEETKPAEERASDEPPNPEIRGAPEPKSPSPSEHPSARMRNQIREELALQKVEEVFARLQDRMKEYYTQWHIYQANPVDDPNAQPPKPLDFAALAKEHHLTAAETGLIPQWELAELDIGKAIAANGEPLAACVFWRTLFPLYRPSIARSFDFLRSECRYLFWKTEETKERVPTFDDAGTREQVLRTWKMVEARRLAKAVAEKLAAEARKAKMPLRQAFGGRTDSRVIEAGPFTWMTCGALPMMMSQEPARLSDVPGVARPGDAFMRAVFDLAPGEIGVAMNQPETAAYVIRMVETRPPDESLWAQFESYPYRLYATAGAADYEQMQRAWLDSLKRSAGLKWERPPDLPRSDEE